MVFEINNEKCTGCSACSSICPQKCIKMIPDNKGFEYPKVEEEMCISCGLCQKVCAVNHVIYHDETKELYAYQNIDEIRRCSTSGGFFTLISDFIIARGGCVYGAAYDKVFMVKHMRAVTKEERNRLRYSKYVQSSMAGICELVKMDLQEHRVVLFTGTPCQISGLNNYLRVSKVNTELLITCDFVCHGVPSPLIWKEYLDFVEKKYKDTILAINFRDKSLGWHKPMLKIEMKNHVQKLAESKDSFYQLYYGNCILRTSCYACAYAKRERTSDITMGDCWGVEQSKPEYDDNKGLSMLLVNTDKGRQMVELLKDGQKFERIRFDDLKQPHLYASAKVSRKKERFWREYHSHKFIYILNKYGNYSIKSKMISWIKVIIVKALK